MSLRREIHQAYDGLSPTTFGMPERVVQTVLNDASRRRKGRLMIRMRAPVSLVAVFVVIAVIAAVLIGGRVLNDWNVFRNGSPAGQAPQTQLQQLEARPLHIPTPKSLAQCQSGPFNATGDLGSGPVFGVGGGISRSSWGLYYHNYAYADTDITGPILVRARDVFKNQPVVFVGRYASGAIAGSDTVDGAVQAQQTEAVFDTSSAVKSGPPSHRYEWDFTAGVPNNWSGSTGWQIDGLSFSETFVVC